MNHIFSEETIQKMRQEIILSNGNEVFFVGKRQNTSIISSVLPIARGNEMEVPVIYDQAFKGDYVIHNHPGGNLTPSGNDLAIASYLGNQGVGFVIINNDVTDVYVVVESPVVEEKQYLDIDQMKSLINQKSSIAKHMDHYEKRDSQIKMIENICDAINEDKLMLIEAGTGIGKSMAYLLPYIHWALSNKEKCVISTNTINLQEQLIQKDIPFLKKALNIDFNAVLVKGRGNYICLRKLQSAQNNTDYELFEQDEKYIIHQIIDSLPVLKEGTRDELTGIITPDTWDKIASETDTCLKEKCSHFNKCFFFKARKQVNQAHILVVNHHILCSDIAIKGEIGDTQSSYGLLPPYQKLVIDEAHNLEDVAINYFGKTTSQISLKINISRLYNLKGTVEKGVLAYFKKQISNWKQEYEHEVIDLLDNILLNDIIPRIQLMREDIEVFFQFLADYMSKQLNNNFFENTIRLVPDKINPSFKMDLIKKSEPLISKMTHLYELLQQFLEKLKDLPYHLREDLLGTIKNLESYTNKILSIVTTIESFVYFKEVDSVYWMELRKKDSNPWVRINISPLNISELLNDFLFDTKETIVMTSATLTTDKSFQFMKKQIGLLETAKERLEEAILASPFNYKEQMSVCIPTDLPDPQNASFNHSVNQVLEQILDITKGGTFILFTSYSMLNHCFEHISNSNTHELILLKQGSMDRHSLINRFKNGNQSVLFGTDSFWEGVDVPGNALRCVILVKLPFKVPTEPITQGKLEKIEREGGNPFLEYTIPQSVIKFRQGFGRLIRTTKDQGVVVCLDKRIITKPYGKIFINSIPDCNMVVGKRDEVYHEIQKYFI